MDAGVDLVLSLKAKASQKRAKASQKCIWPGNPIPDETRNSAFVAEAAQKRAKASQKCILAGN